MKLPFWSNANSQSQPIESAPIAEVVDTILPKQRGQVFFRGSYWNAELLNASGQMAVFPRERVRVIDANRLPLIVMPLDD